MIGDSFDMEPIARKFDSTESGRSQVPKQLLLQTFNKAAKMNRKKALRLTSLPWQASLSLLFTAIVAALIYGPNKSVDLAGVDRATFISALSAVATLVALFCSLSLTWILFSFQQVEGRRTAAYDMMKQCLMEAERWLHSNEPTESRELCLSLVWEINQIALEEIPQLGSIPEYETYCKALDDAVDTEDDDSHHFFKRSAMYFGRIEQLLARFGIASIQQVLISMFINTLAKGFAIVAFSVLVLLCSLLWFSEPAKAAYMLAAAFISAATTLVLLEVWVDLKLQHDEELDFVEKLPKA